MGPNSVVKVGGVAIGNNLPLVLIAGSNRATMPLRWRAR